MGRMSDLHASSAPDRADSSERELAYVKDTARDLADRVTGVEQRLMHLPITKLTTADVTDVLHETAVLREIAADLKKLAG